MLFAPLPIRYLLLFLLGCYTCKSNYSTNHGSCDCNNNPPGELGCCGSIRFCQGLGNSCLNCLGRLCGLLHTQSGSNLVVTDGAHVPVVILVGSPLLIEGVRKTAKKLRKYEKNRKGGSSEKQLSGHPLGCRLFVYLFLGSSLQRVKPRISTPPMI